MGEATQVLHGTRARIFWGPFFPARDSTSRVCGLSVGEAERVCDGGEHDEAEQTQLQSWGLEMEDQDFLMITIVGASGQEREGSFVVLGERMCVGKGGRGWSWYGTEMERGGEGMILG